MYRATTANLAHTHYYDPAAEFESIGLPQAAPEWEGGRSCSSAAPRFESIGLPKAAPEWEGGDAEDIKAPRELVFQPYCGPNFGEYGNEVRVMSSQLRHHCRFACAGSDADIVSCLTSGNVRGS